VSLVIYQLCCTARLSYCIVIVVNNRGFTVHILPVHFRHSDFCDLCVCVVLIGEVSVLLLSETSSNHKFHHHQLEGI